MSRTETKSVYERVHPRGESDKRTCASKELSTLFTKTQFKKVSAIFEWNVHNRQQTVRQLDQCPNCLSEHSKVRCNRKCRCQIDNCNDFHLSTKHRNNFNVTQASNKGRNQSNWYKDTRETTWTETSSILPNTNISSPWNEKASSTNPNYNHNTRENGDSNYNRQRRWSRYSSNNYDNNGSSSSNNNIYGNYINKNNYKSHNQTRPTGNPIRCLNYPRFSNSSRKFKSTISTLNRPKTAKFLRHQYLKPQLHLQ